MDDYYSSNPVPENDEMPGRDETKPHEDEDSGETALLPKSILAGKEFKPGDEVVLEIVHLYEDEVEVKYAKDKPDGDKPKMKSTMEQSEEDMGKYAKEM